MTEQKWRVEWDRLVAKMRAEPVERSRVMDAILAADAALREAEAEVEASHAVEASLEGALKAAEVEVRRLRAALGPIADEREDTPEVLRVPAWALALAGAALGKGEP